MRVLQFIPSLNPYDGGTATYIQQLAPALARRCELHVCCLRPVDGDTASLVHPDGATVHYIELRPWHWRRMRREWTDVLDAVTPDVVHINCCWMPQCAMVQRWFTAWRRRRGRTTAVALLTPHGMLEPWLIERHYWTRKLPAIWLYQRTAVRAADAVVATAEAERQNLLHLGWNKQVVVVPNGIAAAAIESKSEWRAVRRLLFMSRVHPKKGIDILLDALSRVECPDITLDIVGEGEAGYVATLQADVERRGLAERVRFLGPIYGDAKWQHIREADLVVLPSHSENFGLIVAEALASGTPVVTTTGTPWSSLVETGSGWWVEPAADAVAAAIREAAALSPAEVEDMGRRARLLVKERYSVESQAAQMMVVYESVLARAGK